MKDMAANPAWLLLMLVSIYWLCMTIRRRTGNPLANPVLIGTLLMIGYLKLTETSYQAFWQAGQYAAFWLQPAVVCLAVPLYQQWPKIRKQWLPIVASQLVGSVVGIVSGVCFAHWLGASREVSMALAAKSVTLPIALDITQVLGGIPSISAAGVILAGLTGQMAGFWLLRRSGIRNRISHALAQGTASHAMGIAASLEVGGKFAAYATLGLIFNGVLTSFIAPLIVPWLGI